MKTRSQYRKEWLLKNLKKNRQLGQLEVTFGVDNIEGAENKIKALE